MVKANGTWKRTGLVVLGLALGGCADLVADEETRGVVAKVPLSGAIFTTVADGTRVNANLYEEKCDVYLNGGPRREGSAGLPKGDYFFQVTDPSGKVLLSTDPVVNRQFHVDENGRISGLSGLGNHATSPNVIDGGVTVQLCLFQTTPNPGCEYKVWVTRIEDYQPVTAGDDLGPVVTADDGKHGFRPSRSKTDNFKVCEEDDGGGEEEEAAEDIGLE